MKKFIHTFAGMLVPAMLSLLASCSSDRSNQVTTDSLASDYKATALSARDTTPPDSVKTIAPFPLSSQGVGNVRIGASMHHLPDSVPGLYDTVVKHDGTALLVKNDTTVIIATAGADRLTIATMEVTSSMVRVSVGSNQVAVGDKLKPLTSVRGFRHYPMSDTTEEYYLWRNIRLIPTPDGSKVAAFIIGQD